MKGKSRNLVEGGDVLLFPSCDAPLHSIPQDFPFSLTSPTIGPGHKARVGGTWWVNMVDRPAGNNRSQTVRQACSTVHSPCPPPPIVAPWGERGGEKPREAVRGPGGSKKNASYPPGPLPPLGFSASLGGPPRGSSYRRLELRIE